MKEFVTSARIVDGILKMANRQHLETGLRSLGNGTVLLRIERSWPKRTDGQNRFWHGVVVPLFADHCGEEFEDMKRILALELLPVTMKRLDGSEVIVPGHTSDLNTHDFKDLIRRAQQLGASMDIYIPDPGEYLSGVA